MLKLKNWLLTGIALTITLLSVAPLASAADPTNKSAKDDKTSSSEPSVAPVTQTYGTEGTLQIGMLVQLGPKDHSKVQPMTYERSDQMLGVVVAANGAALTLSSQQKDRHVYVATYGQYDVLVSNQNGPIQPGDYVSISNLNGIGMKADAYEKTIVGKALTGFNGTSNVIGTAPLTGSDGTTTQVSLGRVKVDIAVTDNPLRSPGLPDKITRLLGSIGYSVNNKPVSPVRVYLALLILLIATVVSVSLLFAAVRNAMTSIGRNPLAKSMIVSSMLKAVFTSLIIFIIGIFAVYLLLKL